MLFQDFQAGHHGGNFGYWNGMNLAILNIHVIPMSPKKFGLNPTYCLGAEVVWRFSRWPLWWPSWILELNKFSNSESLFCSNASHQVSAQSDLWFGRGCLWGFSRWPIWQPSWISKQNDFSNSKSPCGPNASHQVWGQSDLGFKSRCGFKMATQAAILDSLMEWFKLFWISVSLRCLDQGDENWISSLLCPNYISMKIW